MKKLAFFLLLLNFISSITLYTTFNYEYIVCLLHTVVFLIMLFGIGIINIGSVIFIPNELVSSSIIRFVNFVFFLFSILLFILIYSSNAFWGKTITLKILSNYLSNINVIVNILPVKSWILYLLFFSFIALSTLVYFIFLNSNENRVRNWRQRYLSLKKRPILLLLAIVGLAILSISTVQIKRYAQFRGEPITQFFFGPIWGAVDNKQVAFDPERIQKGLNDKRCIDSLKKQHRPEDSLNVVIILLDALRKDHLPKYGYNRKTTPFLDSLQNSGSLSHVKNVYSTSNGTVGGMAGLFFSKDYDDFGYNGLSLMKYFKSINYTTVAFLTGFHRDWYDLSALYRENCDYYYESAIDLNKNEDDDLVTLNAIKDYQFKSKSFIYIHLLSTHTIGKKNTAYKKYFPDKTNLFTNKIEAITNNYDNGILQADFVISEIFKKLASNNLLSNSIIYITSDHGEMLGEDNMWSHGKDIHPKLLEIPLLIYDVNKEWYNNLNTATIKDIAPTAIDRLGLDVPSCWQGNSLHNKEANSFTIKVNSVSAAKYPFALLTKKDSSLHLDVMNSDKIIKKKYINSNGVWELIK